MTIGEIPKNTSYPIVEETDFWYQINFLGRVGFVWKANTSLDEVYFSPTNNISIYKHMTGKETIGSLYKGQLFPLITDEFVNWYKVKVGNRFGYIKKSETVIHANKNVAPLNIETQNNPIIIKANSTLYVKENISGKQKTIGTINKNFIFPTLKELDNWFQLEFSGRIVYVWKENTTLLD